MSPEAYTSAAELVEEIAFQKICLKSLDDSTDNREEVEAAIMAELRTLEKQLHWIRQREKEQKAAQTAPALNTEPNYNSLSTPSSASTGNGFGVFDGSFGASLHAGTGSSTSSTPNSAVSGLAVSSLLNPSQINIPSRKRSHGEHIGLGTADDSESKSRRGSPAPSRSSSTKLPRVSGRIYPVLDNGFVDLTAFVYTKFFNPSMSLH